MPSLTGEPASILEAPAAEEWSIGAAPPPSFWDLPGYLGDFGQPGFKRFFQDRSSSYREIQEDARLAGNGSAFYDAAAAARRNTLYGFVADTITDPVNLAFAAGTLGEGLAARWLGEEALSDVAASAARGARNPVVREAADYGRWIHKTYDYGPGFEPEFRLPSGRRADAVNLETREVLELKPNNPQAIQRGQRQLESYLKELEQTYGGEWTGRVITYDR